VTLCELAPAGVVVVSATGYSEGTEPGTVHHYSPAMNIYTATAEQLQAAISLNRAWMENHASEENTTRFQDTLRFSQSMSDQLLALMLAA
jgi:hypothetical protein